MVAAPTLLAAADLGNTAAKIGLADLAGRAFLAEARWTGAPQRLANLVSWNGLSLPDQPLTWAVSSVQTRRRDSLREWLIRERPADRWIEFAWTDVPLPHDVLAPERVGMDRWMGCVAAANIWGRSRAGSGASGLVVLAGTAVTVNLLRDGVFAGGAIVPGFDLSLSALHQGTDKLPDLVGRVTDLVDLPGRDTEFAVRGGVGWGLVGAVRELGRRMTADIAAPQWILSGGNAELLATGLESDVQIVETLTLDGIAETFLAAGREACPVGDVPRDSSS